MSKSVGQRQGDWQGGGNSMRQNYPTNNTISLNSTKPLLDSGSFNHVVTTLIQRLTLIVTILS